MCNYKENTAIVFFQEIKDKVAQVVNSKYNRSKRENIRTVIGETAHNFVLRGEHEHTNMKERAQNFGKRLKSTTKTYTQLILPSNKSINSTHQFISIIKNFNLQPDHKMLSFDAVNLYPSIDIQEIINIVNEAIKEYFNETPYITNLRSTINLVLDNSYFQYQNRIYKQINGFPMGSPIFGKLADWKL